MNKNLKLQNTSHILVFFLILAFPASSNITFAVDPQQNFGGMFGAIYNLLYPIAIIYGIFEIVVAGYRIMKSEGEPNTLRDAKEHLTNAIIGVIFVILAVVILKVIIKTFLWQDL